jgi:hypothetical protein
MTQQIIFVYRETLYCCFKKIQTTIHLVIIHRQSKYVLKKNNDVFFCVCGRQQKMPFSCIFQDRSKMQFILDLSFANLQNSAVRLPSDNKTTVLAKFFDLYFF